MPVPAGLAHRERFIRCINYQEVDRPPIFFKADISVQKRLQSELGLAEQKDLLTFFDADAMHIHPVQQNKPNINVLAGRRALPQDEYYDVFGNRLKRLTYMGQTQEAVLESALGDTEEINDVYTKVNWPTKDYINVAASIKGAEAARRSGLAVYSGVWCSIFTNTRRIIGEEHFLISCVTNPEFVAATVRRLTDSYLEMNKAYFDSCAKYIDVFYFGSDIGTQNSLYIGPDMFRRLFWPDYKRLCSQAKEYGLKVLYHTCGAVSGIIPDLIEAGVDILDPLQATATNMAPAQLAAAFKGKICFHGGISTQRTLPFGTVDEVREETKRVIETLGPLGYVATPDHVIMPDTPTENILAMYETMRCYKV